MTFLGHKNTTVDDHECLPWVLLQNAIAGIGTGSLRIDQKQKDFLSSIFKWFTLGSYDRNNRCTNWVRYMNPSEASINMDYKPYLLGPMCFVKNPDNTIRPEACFRTCTDMVLAEMSCIQKGKE